MKTCPVCSAKAFDDAAVCYGCLHRFGEDSASADGVLPLASVPAVSEDPRSLGASGLAPTGPMRAAAPPVRTGVGEAPWPFEPVCDAASSVSGAIPLDRQGLVVRFEFPGFAPGTCCVREIEGTGSEDAKPDEECSLLKRGCESKNSSLAGGGSSCGLIVQFQSDRMRMSENRRRKEALRGTHAREEASRACVLVPVPEPA